jgi:hypothetical protein
MTEFIAKLVETIVNPLIRLMFAAATTVFLWGVMKYIRNSESPEERQKGRVVIIYGLIGMVIMMGVFGIMTIAKNSIF